MQQLKTQGAADLQDHARPNKPQRSRFDLSKITNLTLEPGMIVPVDLFEVLPGDDIDIDNEMVLDTLPMVAPSLTKYKILVHWYYMKARDCWKGFKTFWTRGRTGNVNLTVPKIKTDLRLAKKNLKYGSDNQNVQSWIRPVGYHSLQAFITGTPNRLSGFPEQEATTIIKKEYLPYCATPAASEIQEWTNIIKTGHNGTGDINALPFVMYQSIVKNNYVNENLLQDNKALFPEEGDDDWILPYNATTVNFIGRGETNNDDWNDGEPEHADDWKFDYTGIFHDDDTRVRLDLLRYAMFDNDYFTNGLPWLQRGELEEGKGLLPFDLTGITLTNLNGTFAPNGDYPPVKVAAGTGMGALGATWNGSQMATIYTKGGQSPAPQNNTDLVTDLSGKRVTIEQITAQIGNAQSTINTNQLREMIAMQVWMERNARVDGSYNRMIYQHWLEDPNSEEHKPYYIGGTADYVSFATVVQNSESTDSNPLGSTAGFGSARGGSKAGSFRANDFGYVMGIMIIKPDTTYQQGLEHFWKHEDVFDKMVQPEFQGLSPEPIYNDEIYISSDENTNKGLFCYQERYQYLKQRLNMNKGMFTAAPEKDRLFSAYTQARWFNNLPTFNYQFLVMSPENIRRDMLAYPNYPMFRIQFASKVFVTRKLAYTSEPNTFGY